MMGPKFSQAKRFLNRVLILKKSDCWEWQGALSRDGYGQIRLGKVMTLAHRFSWRLHNGTEPPREMEVRHSCDNPKCVNPYHLILGTHEENMKDMVARSRSLHRTGELNPNVKLTKEQVDWCKRFVARGNTRVLAASKLGVHPSTVDRIIKGQSWKSQSTSQGTGNPNFVI